jgi:hypothetical protein
MKTNEQIAADIIDLLCNQGIGQGPIGPKRLAAVKQILDEHFPEQATRSLIHFGEVQEKAEEEQRATQVPFAMPVNPSCGHCGSSSVRPSRQNPGKLTCNSCGLYTEQK